MYHVECICGERRILTTIGTTYTCKCRRVCHLESPQATTKDDPHQGHAPPPPKVIAAEYEEVL